MLNRVDSKKQHNKIKFSLSALVIVTTLFTSATAFADATLKLSHNQDKNHPVHLSMQFMADEAKRLSDGGIKIRIYPNSQLGTQRESMELMQNGALDMVKSNASEMESFEPAYGAFNVPYLFTDIDHYYRALEGEVGKEILQASKDKGFIGLTYYDAGARSFYAKKPINTPADLNGLKIRVQPSPTAVKMIELMGGAPTPLAYGELYTALQQGVVDGAENNPTALTTARHGEVANIFSLDEHTMIPDVLLISSTVWDGLSPEDQKIIQQAADASMQHHKTLWQEMTAASMKEAEETMNVQFVTVEKKPFQDAVKPIRDEAINNPAIAEYVKQIEALK
ncbi:TRAP transporter substrate-binding protein [Thorsellia kenyensis]|uniref:TRAP transporter substrate-binding protein n=1 Tax=Thorsellia kenyensis TaxID=1549888 RepID=A0ABV6CC73_9GAMM